MLLAETPVLSFERQGANSFELYWHEAGTLQESTNLIHWDDTTEVQSPLRFSLEDIDSRIFYRVLQP